MIENLYEQCVYNDNTAGSQTKFFLICSGAIVCFCIAFFSIVGALSAGAWNMLLFGIPSLVAGIFLWIKKDEAYLEYEYDFSCGDLEIAKIINNKKRKNMCKFACSEVEVIGTVNAPNYNRYSSMPNIKKIYATFAKKNSENVYFVFYVGKKGKVLLHFEPDEEMIGFMKKHLKVHIDTVQSFDYNKSANK